MLNSEDVGNSSSRKHNSEKSPDGERPLKKARFAWQIKGKYHLKEQDNSFADEAPAVHHEAEPAKTADSSSDDSNSSEKMFDNGSDDTVYSEKTIDSENDNAAEQNLENLGDYLMKQDFNELENDSIDSRFMNTLHTVGFLSNVTGQSLRQSQVPIGVGEACQRANGGSGDVEIVIYPSMVNKGVEDQILARWQARQLAKGFVDNTINRVLDSWLIAPPPPTMDQNRHMALDVAEFLDNLPGSNRIENEGILMAISAHGLQKNFEVVTRRNAGITGAMHNSEVSSSPYESLDTDFETDRLSDIKEHTEGDNSRESEESPFNLLSSSESYSDEEIDEDEYLKRLNWKEGTPNPWITRRKVPRSKKNVAVLFPKFPKNSNKEVSQNDAKALEDGESAPKEENERTDQLCESPETQHNDETDRSATSDNTFEPIYNDHLDFMNAAVSFAIQNKGLASLGTDYG